MLTPLGMILLLNSTRKASHATWKFLKLEFRADHVALNAVKFSPWNDPDGIAYTGKMIVQLFQDAYHPNITDCIKNSEQQQVEDASSFLRGRSPVTRRSLLF